jgi:hypothetical protein
MRYVMIEWIMAIVTAVMAVATFLLALQTIKMRREQTRPVLAIHQYWEDENPPKTGADYEMAAYDGGGKLLDLALGHSDEKAVVYYIMINNLGNGSARNLEVRMKGMFEIKDNNKIFILEENSVSIRELYPGGTMMVPVLALDANVSDTTVQCIVKYIEIDRFRYLGLGFDERPWVGIGFSWRNRFKLALPLRFRTIPRLEAKRDLFYKALWDSEDFKARTPMKNLTLPQFAVTKHEIVSTQASQNRVIPEEERIETHAKYSRFRRLLTSSFRSSVNKQKTHITQRDGFARWP